MKKVIVLMVLVVSLFGEISKGDKAIDFNLKTLDGTKSYKLSDFKGEVVLLNLWASWCGGCKKEMPEFFNLQKEYKSGFKIVTVSIDKDRNNAVDFLSSVEKSAGFKTPFVSLYDPKKGLARAYGARGMPSSYLIDKNGVVVLVMIGSLSHSDIAQLKTQIDKLK